MTDCVQQRCTFHTIWHASTHAQSHAHKSRSHKTALLFILSLWCFTYSFPCQNLNLFWKAVKRFLCEKSPGKREIASGLDTFSKEVIIAPRALFYEHQPVMRQLPMFSCVFLVRLLGNNVNGARAHRKARTHCIDWAAWHAKCVRISRGCYSSAHCAWPQNMRRETCRGGLVLMRPRMSVAQPGKTLWWAVMRRTRLGVKDVHWKRQPVSPS